MGSYPDTDVDPSFPEVDVWSMNPLFVSITLMKH